MRFIQITVLLVATYYMTMCVEVEASTCRSASVKHRFEKSMGFPHGRPGYVIDHICALENGGIDSATLNMQYQTIVEGKAKDKIERTPAGKVKWCNETNSTPIRQVFNCY